MNTQSFGSNFQALNGRVALTHWGVIRAKGADALAFLHGQLTQDVLHLSERSVRLAGYCSAKGRLLASFYVCRWLDDEVLLICHQSVLVSTLKRLSMFVLRAQCKLSDATQEFGLVGVCGKVQAQNASSVLLSLPEVALCARAIELTELKAGQDDALLVNEVSLEQWQQLEVLSGVAMIEQAGADCWVPQMVNFELTGGVDFQKGCYPGQEVVARSQYRGTLKRRMFLFETAELAHVGLEIYSPADPEQPAGSVVNVAQAVAGQGSYVLAEVKWTLLESSPLRLGGLTGAVLVQQPLPYEVPLERL